MLNLLIKNSDYISLDTLGFAQVGFDDYFDKIIIEKKIIELFFKDNPVLAVPLNFVPYAFFKWEQRPHDFGTYWDFIIVYDTDYINLLEKNECHEMVAEFWDWISRCEVALSDNEEVLLTKCKNDYENA